MGAKCYLPLFSGQRLSLSAKVHFVDKFNFVSHRTYFVDKSDFCLEKVNSVDKIEFCLSW